MSKKVILYIAVSVDGYIARENGAVDWLPEPEPEQSEDFGYNEFIQTIDTVLMGHTTYKQVLSFGGEYPYTGKRNYVFTHDKSLEQDEHVEYVHSNAVAFVNALKVTGFKNIWLVGGAQLFNFLFAHGVVDELILFVMPIALGKGIPLWQGPSPEQALELTKMVAHPGGVVELRYHVLRAEEAG